MEFSTKEASKRLSSVTANLTLLLVTIPFSVELCLAIIYSKLIHKKYGNNGEYGSLGSEGCDVKFGAFCY